MRFDSFHLTWLVSKRSLNVFSRAYSYNILRNALLYLYWLFWIHSSCLFFFQSDIIFFIWGIGIIHYCILNITVEIICIKSSSCRGVSHYLLLLFCFIGVRNFLNFWICTYCFIIASICHTSFCSKTKETHLSLWLLLFFFFFLYFNIQYNLIR